MSSGSDNTGAANQAGERSIKASGNGPYVVYFCSERLAQTAGIGSEAIRAKIKAGVRPLKDTVFESNSVLDAFKKAGLKEFFRVLGTKENAALAQKYKVTQDNTLVFCAPNGEVIVSLAGAQCSQTTVMKLLKSWSEVYDAWQKKNAK